MALYVMACKRERKGRKGNVRSVAGKGEKMAKRCGDLIFCVTRVLQADSMTKYQECVGIAVMVYD
jgi:hypothetical protein